MRTYNTNFSTLAKARQKELHITVELAFDKASTDFVYFTSGPGAKTPIGATVYQNTVKSVSGTQSKFDPKNFSSTIGSLSLELVDLNSATTQLLKDKFNAGNSVSSRRVRVYIGYDNLAWSDYEIAPGGTQIVYKSSFKDGVNRFICSDIKRETKKEIFSELKSILLSPVAVGDTTIRVTKDSGWQLVQHGLGWGDSPNASVVYFKLQDEWVKSDTIVQGVNYTEFQNCSRGYFGSIEKDHLISNDDGAQVQLEVFEGKYLDLPGPKALLALLTNQLHNQGGAVLPDHWGLGIPMDFIQLSDFTSLGSDMWNESDDSSGFRVRFLGTEAQNGKQFIEQQILKLMTCRMPTYANGKLGLQKLQYISGKAQYVATLDVNEVCTYTDLNHEHDQVINTIIADWNYDVVHNSLTRRTALRDQDSIDLETKTEPHKVQFLGLSGVAHASSIINRYFNFIRDRYAYHPKTIDVTVMPSFNYLEPGDIVRLKLPVVRDYTGTDIELDSSFEIQSVSIDWATGIIGLKLFGSSRKVEQLVTGTGLALNQSQMEALAPASNYINTTNFPGVYAGGVLNTCTLTGQASMSSGNTFVYFHAGDLTIAAGEVVSLAENVFLVVFGDLIVNGTIDGSGKALATIYPQARGIGTAIAGGGVHFRTGSLDGVFSEDSAPVVVGDKQKIDASNVYVSATGQIIGIPADLRGTTGNRGGKIHQTVRIKDEQTFPWENTTYTDTAYDRVFGGPPGEGAAGLVVLANNLSFGPSGSIKLSGFDGAAGPTYDSTYLGKYKLRFHAGGGAGGCPGGFVLLLNDPQASQPVIEGKVIQKSGLTPMSGIRLPDVELHPWFKHDKEGTTDVYSYYNGKNNSVAEQQDESENLSKVIRLEAYSEPVPDIPKYADYPIAITLDEILNQPKTLNANLSSIQINLTKPADTNFDHAAIYYRRAGTGEPWVYITKVYTSTVVGPFASDGTQYEFEARAVSIRLIESETGYRTSITLTDIETNLDGINVPNISGLEIKGQGNNFVFTGKDVHLAWRDASAGDNYEFGQEPDSMGADAGRIDQYFDQYVVDVFSGSVKLNTYFTKNNEFTYSYEMNVKDGGPRRELTFKVRMRTRLNQFSSVPDIITVNNPQPELPGGLSIAGGFSRINVSFNEPDDLDYKGAFVWVSTSSGFAPGSVSLVKTLSRGINETVIDYLPDGSKISQNTNYFVRLGMFDDFGLSGYTLSSEILVKTIKATEDKKNGLSDWATQFDPAGKDFIMRVLQGDAIPSEKIENVEIAKLLAGVLRVVIELQSEGLIKVIGGNGYDLTLGQQVDGGTTYIQRFGNESTSDWVFTIDVDGNATYSGALNAATGTFLGNLQSGSYKTSVTGKRVEINPSNDNEIHFYGDRGDTTIEELATIGIKTSGSDAVIGYFGTTSVGNSRIALYGNSYSGIAIVGVSTSTRGVWGFSTSSNGVQGTSTSGNGVYGISSSGIGVIASSGTYGMSTTGSTSPLRLVPSAVAAAPTHSALAGSLWVTSTGVLYINATGGTTWQKVGAQ